MKRHTVMICCTSLVCLAFGHGLTVSTTEEVYDQVDFIYEIKITDVSKPEQAYSGAEPYTIKFTFELINSLKGTSSTNIANGTFTLPSLEHKSEDGTVIRKWLKVPASGEEESVIKDERYLIYFKKYGIQEETKTVAVIRIDPVAKKPELLKLLNQKNTPNQQVDPIVKTSVDEIEAQGTQGHP